MTISIEIFRSEDDRPQIEVATNLGWAQFIEHVQGLDIDDYQELYQLAEHGVTDDSDSLIDELSIAIDVSGMDDAVLGVAQNVLGIVLEAESDDVILATNGIETD